MTERENNYDLLRIVSSIAVIMIHVSSIWLDRIDIIIANGPKNNLCIENMYSPAVICIYNSISRFAVPCFIMLSGAFILDNERNLDYKTFYCKSFAKVGIPTIVFSFIYILYRLPFCFIIRDDTSTLIKINTLLKDIIIGSPMYHMWYLYMLIGIYAMVPIILRFKNSITPKMFYKISFVFLVLACISRWTTESVGLNWNIGQSFEYLGYFMIGYSIRKLCHNKNNLKSCSAIILGLLIELCAAKLKYVRMIDGIPESELQYRITSPYSPLIVLSSILIFYGFSVLKINSNFSKCSNLTLYIYLIHAGVWDIIGKMFKLFKINEYFNMNGAIWIILFTVILFIISYYLSKLYLWLWNSLNKRNKITEFIMRAIHLQIE